MARKVQAVYDFDGQEGTTELSIKSGDIITLIETEGVDGWLEGTNTNGESGFFPEAYVEEYNADDDTPPPSSAPPFSSDFGDLPPPSPELEGDDDSTPINIPQNDLSGTTVEITTPPTDEAIKLRSGESFFSDYEDEEGNFLLSTKSSEKTATLKSGDVSSLHSKSSNALGSKATLSRRSTFVKSGCVNYILGQIDAEVGEADIIQLVEDGDGKYSWLNSNTPYSCSIASFKKESKFKGLVSTVAYQLHPSFNYAEVSRSYKQFDWVHERLAEKFVTIPIPPLPGAYEGLSEDEFIDHRMNKLQSFVNRVCIHPVLSQSEVWRHFLTAKGEKEWKIGKKKVENDPLVGGSWFMSIKAPETHIDSSFIDHEVEVFSNFTGAFYAAVKNMMKTAQDQTAKCKSQHKHEFQTISKAFLDLGKAMELDGSLHANNLTSAIKFTGDTYEEIAKLVEDGPRNYWEHLGDIMHDYRGMLSGWPGVLKVHSGAIVKKKEADLMKSEGKLNQHVATEIINRADVLSYALLAEINTFHYQRGKDMVDAHKNFLKEQMNYYQTITEKFRDALGKFDDC